MRDFVAFDVETANSNKHSICAIGLVFVENGKIADKVYSLIDPKERFDYRNIQVHGLDENDVAGAPTFSAFYKSIRDQLENRILVAHYMGFDGYALRDALEKEGIIPAPKRLMCTHQLAKRMVKGMSSYNLKILCNHFGITLEHHHNALEDALACAHLLQKLSDEYKITDESTLEEIACIKLGTYNEQEFRTSRVKKVKNAGFDISNIEVNLDGDNTHPFYQKNIVFTGALDSFTRKEAAELVAVRGGVPQKGVTKNSNYVVLGEFESELIKGNKSSKLVKAEGLIGKGADLEIISEIEFLKML
ncbi:DNA polymerase III subunit epsilon [Priestia megaterium]|nr:DNA polymerase III subunit epsilon [Priestia megaterium]